MVPYQVQIYQNGPALDESHPSTADDGDGLAVKVEAHKPVEGEISILRSGGRTVHLAVECHQESDRVLRHSVRATVVGIT